MTPFTLYNIYSGGSSSKAGHEDPAFAQEAAGTRRRLDKTTGKAVVTKEPKSKPETVSIYLLSLI